MSYARARHETPYGIAEAGWAEDSGGLRVHARVPANATAIVELPNQEAFTVAAGLHEWSIPDPRISTDSSAPGEPLAASRS